MKINIVSLFDKGYLVRATAMLDSAREVMPDVHFYFLCMDAESKFVLDEMRLEGVSSFVLDDINDPELLAIRGDRSQSEFAFTAKPASLNYVANRSEIADGDAIVWTDADIIYFSTLKPLLERMNKEGHCIGITPHRFPKRKEYMNERVGKYNSGFVIFIMNDTSRSCIREWREQCIEWCYMRYEKGRLGDQAYLVEWHNKYQGVYDIPDKGVNLGSWGIFNYRIRKVSGSKYLIDDDVLVCYHFHRIRFYLRGKRVVPLPLFIYHRSLYSVCVDRLERAYNKVLSIDPNWLYGFVTKPDILRIIKQTIERSIKNLLRI